MPLHSGVPRSQEDDMRREIREVANTLFQVLVMLLTANAPDMRRLPSEQLLQTTETFAIASLPLARQDSCTQVVETSLSSAVDSAGTNTALSARPTGTKMRHALNIRSVVVPKEVWRMSNLKKKSRSFPDLARNARFRSRRIMAVTI